MEIKDSPLAVPNSKVDRIVKGRWANHNIEDIEFPLPIEPGAECVIGQEQKACMEN